jgi:glycosyltransferase involved in cell wall biosynthesis
MYFDEPRDGSPFSGAEKHLLLLLRAQAERGCVPELLMLVHRHGPQLSAEIKRLAACGIAVHTFAFDLPRHGSRRVKLFRGMRLLNRLRRFLQSRRQSVIHTHLPHADILGTIAARLAGCRHVVCSTHNNEPSHTTWKWRVIHRILGRITQHHIAISDTVRQHLIRFADVAEDRIATIPYGVPRPNFVRNRDTTRRMFGIDRDAFVVGFVGRLVRQKNIPVLLRAIADRPQVECVIAGSGELETELREIAADLALSNVRFLGHVPDAQRLMPALDVLCLPSRWEGLGLVLIEAMLLGVPIIGSRGGAIPEVLGNGQFGMLFDVDDDQALAGALEQARRDPEFLQEISRRARQRAERLFTVSRMVEHTASVYQRVRQLA